MKRTTLLAAVIGIAALSACGTREENVAENVDANALVTDNMMAPADNMANMDMNVGDDMNNMDMNNTVDNTTNNTTGY